jgi:hypothetical protein
MQVFWLVHAIVFGAALGNPMNVPKNLDLSGRQVSLSAKIIA